MWHEKVGIPVVDGATDRILFHLALSQQDRLIVHLSQLGLSLTGLLVKEDTWRLVTLSSEGNIPPSATS